MAIDLLTSHARVQAPWVRVTIGDTTFGVFIADKSESTKDSKGMYKYNDAQYPNFIQSLNIVKTNGQVNQYTLNITYPVTLTSDPNFFEKLLGSVSTDDTKNNIKARKIIFSYGDASMPSFTYKDEEALITNVRSRINIKESTISYTISAVSSAALGVSGCWTFVPNQILPEANTGNSYQPSALIKQLLKTPKYGLTDLFYGMANKENLELYMNSLIPGDDKPVPIEIKTNTSILDYLNYLVSCMIPSSNTTSNLSNEIYILTIHDDTTYDTEFNGNITFGGPYFKITKTSHKIDKTDAYEINIGMNTKDIVISFDVQDDNNYALYYNYQRDKNTSEYLRKLNRHGEWEDIYSPAISSKNDLYKTRPNDISWWTKITQYPISVTIKILGLLRPATLMSHVRLNVIFPGGHKHITSGLYVVTKQVDDISTNGFTTTLSLTKVGGDTELQ